MRPLRVLFLALLMTALTEGPTFEGSLARAQLLRLPDVESGYQDDEEYDDATDDPLPYWTNPGDEQADEWMDDDAVPNAADFLLLT